MLKIYTCLKCRGCCREFILLTSEMKSTINEGKYLACPYCGNKRIREELATDDLRGVAKARSYRKVNGRIREIK